MRIFAMIALSALVFGCVSDRRGSRLDSWQGSHINDVTAAWGAPNDCSGDESQRICTWQVLPNTADITLPSMNRSLCTTMLAFDSDGIVTGWRWRGDRCQQTASIVAANTPGDRPDALSLGADNEAILGVVTIKLND